MNKLLLAGLAFTALTIAGPAAAQQCGNDSSGFDRWVQDFKRVAPSNGISPAVIDRAFANVNYNRATISADRGQKSFKLSFEEFLKKRGAAITTGNQQRVRLLPVFGKNTVALALICIASAHEIAVARKQFGWEIGHEGYEYYAFETRSTARYAQSGASLALHHSVFG